MIYQSSGVGVGNSGFNLLQMPTLSFQMSFNRFIQEEGAIAFHVCGFLSQNRFNIDIFTLRIIQ